ncbi:MAG TPA: ABC transporter permease [Vicinamibacterales bacterium]|jgi:peptide/nickel transport system permease protein|nr:ABC transporter permease [Vicinamibacterales bacterium]
MTAFLIRRLIYLAVLVLVSTAVAYLLAATQLNPRSRYEGRNPPPPPEVVNAALDAINMNDQTPVVQRLRRWASGVVRGDLGLTIESQSVNTEIGRRMWVSLRLMLIGAIVGSLLGVAAGAYSAVKQYRAPDYILTIFSFVTLSIPVVVLAVLFKNGGIGLNNLLGFTGDTKLLYTTGEITPGLDPWSSAGIVNRLAHLVLPSLVLTAVAIAFYGRYQRNAMLDVLGSDFLRTAQAKGLRRSHALVKHGLRTALIPMATFFAYEFALLFVGATFTEKIFGWHGMGEYFVDSVTKNDVNSVAGVTLFVAILVLIAGFLSDVAYAALDPRVRV